MSRHINIPIFIPHLGCPNQCVFCNQRKISGVSEFYPETVDTDIKNALATVEDDAECEIAFFGGSFTGIDRSLMERLLNIAYSYVRLGRVSSIRCSTRPDYINKEILDILKRYGVRTVELGLQSVSDTVLRKTKRGHGSLDELNACRMIVDAGFTLGGQMMIGLPESTLEDEIRTAEFIANCGAKEARIYPTVVFRDTELCEMARTGEYIPLSVDEAASRSAAALKIFIDAGVKVIRIGLCDSDNLHTETSYYAGPNHAAMGELTESEYYYNYIEDELSKKQDYRAQAIEIYCARGHMSKVIGQRRRNKERLIQNYGFSSVKVTENSAVTPYRVSITIKERL